MPVIVEPSMGALQALIVASATWTAWCDVTAPDTPADHVHLFDAPPPADVNAGYAVTELQAMRPAAIIRPYFAETAYNLRSYGAKRIATGQMVDFGRLIVDLSDDVPGDDAGDQRVAESAHWMNVVGLIKDMMALQDGDGTLVAESIVVFAGPVRSKRTAWGTDGDVFRTQLLVEWALDQGRFY